MRKTDWQQDMHLMAYVFIQLITILLISYVLLPHTTMLTTLTESAKQTALDSVWVYLKLVSKIQKLFGIGKNHYPHSELWQPLQLIEGYARTTPA